MRKSSSTFETALTSSASDSLIWSRKWLTETHLRRTYLAMAAPGGAAVEMILGAPAGISHLLEHLLYRQNDLSGNPLDRWGGKFGLKTGRDTMLAFLSFHSQDMQVAAQLIEQWWDNLQVTPELLAQEVSVVVDEIEQVRKCSSADSHLRQELLNILLPKTYLEQDFAGEPDILFKLTPEDVLEYHKQIRSLGAAVVAVGPEPLWNETTISTEPVNWKLPINLENKPGKRIEKYAIGLRHTVVTAARLVEGLSSSSALGSYAAYASLKFGRLHHAQRRFHVEMGLRYLNFDLHMYADIGILFATARCPTNRMLEVADLLEELLKTVGQDSDGDRLYKVLLHHLGWMRDIPYLQTTEEAIRTLYKLESLNVVLEKTKGLSPCIMHDLIEKSMLDPVVVGICARAEK